MSFTDGDFNYEITSGMDVQVASLFSTVLGSYTIPTTCTDGINTYTVVALKPNAFLSNIYIQGINIQASVTVIAPGAFNSCTSLTNINLPSTLITIDSCFQRCNSLINLNLSNLINLTSMNGTFKDCTGLRSIILPINITTMNNTFSGCSSILSVDISKNLNIQSLGGTFNNCTSLINVNLPNNLQYLDTFTFPTFNGCSSLTTITLPNTLKGISIATFNGCTLLASIVIPASVTTIRSQAFNLCTSLRNIYFLGSFGSSFATNAFTNIGTNNNLFYNSIYSSYATYTTNFVNRYPFTLISSLESEAKETTSKINFSAIFSVTSNQSVIYSIYDENDSLYDTFAGVNITSYIFKNLNPSTTYNFTMSIELNPIIQTGIPISFTTLSVPISDICFGENTLILTDQGYIPIQFLSKKNHTIRKEKIIEITRTIGQEDYLILLKPHALEKNKPFCSTILSPNHKIMNFSHYQP